MTALAIFGLGVPELLIILAVVLLLFGGTRLAGLGKSSGRALKEFKEETKGLKQEGPNPPRLTRRRLQPAAGGHQLDRSTPRRSGSRRRGRRLPAPPIRNRAGTSELRTCR